MGNRRLRVYMAASRDVAGQADAIARQLTEANLEVVSRWHVNETKLVDPSSLTVRSDILSANLDDLSKADVVVALMDRGSPRATYAEIGWALANRQYVVWLKPETLSEGEYDPRACIFDAHDNVRIAKSECEIVLRLEELWVRIIDLRIGAEEGSKTDGV